MFAKASMQQKKSTKKKKQEQKKLTKFTPHPYQKKSISFLTKNECGGLFLAPGLGKTIITLKAFEELKKQKLSGKILIVAKLRIIYNVWPKEIDKWGLGFKVGMLHGSKKNNVLEQDDIDVYLINYEGLEWLKKNLSYLPKDLNTIVFDESSKLKSTKTKRFKVVKAIMHRFERRWILTGSPAPNSLKDIFGQIFVLDNGRSLGRYITQFLNTYFYPSGYMGYDWKLIPGADEKIYKKIKPLVLRFGHDLIELPDLVKVNRHIDLPAKIQKQYKELEKEFILQLEEGIILANNAGVATNKLRQVTGGNIYTEDRKHIHLHDEKIEELKELVEELQGRPLLVAFEFEHEWKELKKHFPHAEVIKGGVNPKKSKEIEDKWNAGEIDLLFGQPESIAHGLNLQEGDCCDIAFYTTPWSLENYEQFIQRVWRQGQKNKVTVHHFIVNNSVDEAVMKAINRKDKTQQGLLDALKEHYL